MIAIKPAKRPPLPSNYLSALPWAGSASCQWIATLRSGKTPQYDDDTYAQARARIDGQDGALPAYPGGPLPGEEPIDGDIGV